MYITTSDPHNTFPKLKGRAAECKSLVPALAHVWAEYMRPDRPEEATVLQGLLHSARMDEILDMFPDEDVLPARAAAEFSEATWGYAQCQDAVASYYNRTVGYQVFDVTVKTHWMLHSAMVAAFFNPRKSWNYSGEDFMHKSKTLLQACMVGNSFTRAVIKFAGKYTYAMHLLFMEFENNMR